MSRLLYFIPVLFLAASCSLLPGHGSKQKPVARVNDTYLYPDDLKGLVPAGTEAKDSTDLVKTYINNWIRQQLLLQQAENNLSSDKINFSKELEQYRNSLIMYEYESELVRQKLDTVITEKEITDYYDANQANFQLRENIVKAAYIVVPLNSAIIPKMRNLLRSDKSSDQETLENLCQKQATTFSLDAGNWISFGTLQKTIPMSTNDQENFLNSNSYFEVQDSASRYMVRIYDYKTRESVSPLSFEIQNIRAVILNKRKTELLSRMEEDLFNNALKKKKFEIY
jgi:hypothetical protein